MNALLEDQLDYLSPLQKNMVCGAATGAVFKSTLGVVPTAFGAVLGAGLAGAIHLLTEAGNKSGYIGFEMKFWLYLFNNFLKKSLISLIIVFIVRFYSYK